MPATLSALARQYVYVPFTNLVGFTMDTVTYARLAFLTDPTAVPVDADWKTPIIVGSSAHALWVKAGSVPSLAILIGPARGDVVTTVELALVNAATTDYQVWWDLKVPNSDERPTDSAGVLTIRKGS